MTPAAYRAALTALGLSQARFSRLVDVTPDTSTRWATGARRIPGAVALLLGVLLAGRVTIEELETRCGPRS